MDKGALAAQAAQGQEAMVAFAQRLIQTPSLSGQEGAVAALVEAEMQALGYDEVWRDRAGNVIGRVRATADGGARRRIMFNTHIDQVDVGDPAGWPYPPFSATVADGHLWGRGASDLKGPLAVQVHAVAAVKRLGVPIPNDLYVSAVVQEEVGGLGAHILGDEVRCDYCILGEPTTNRLMRGHRGRVEVDAVFRGRSVHASMPDLGVNPLYAVARFLEGLPMLPVISDPAEPALGATTCAPTLIRTDQTSANVVPGEVRLTLDCRNVPSDPAEAVIARLTGLLRQSLVPGASGEMIPVPRVLTSYTGLQVEIGPISLAFSTPADHPLVVDGARIMSELLGREVVVGLWPFATDGGHFVAGGAACLGYSPGYEEVIHTVDERISLQLMEEAYAGNMALALEL